MTIRLSTLVSPEFQESFKRVLAARAPALTGYWLAKLSKVFAAEAQSFNEVRDNLLIELGTPIEGQPGQYSIPPENVSKFTDELTSLDHDVELDLPEGLKLKLPDDFIPGDWSALIALDLFDPPA
jgi:hypothetical protein